jgi:3-oxoacyl-[acyl-carrier-protein] synthase III
MPERYAKITGWGKYVPEKVLTNADLEKMVDTSDEWITTRTGIKERHIRAEGENSSHMSVKSGLAALEKAGLKPTDLDLIIVACSSPDYYMPSVANQVQDMIGARCGAFAITAGCSGWVYALVTATQFIQSGTMNNVLVIGTEIISYAVDYTDRATCVLFGDGSAAVVLQASEEPAGVLASELGSDGSGAEAIIVYGGATATPMSQRVLDERLNYLRMNGAEVFKFATRTVAASMKRVIDKAGLLPDDIQLFIPHQANARIIEASARLMRQPIEKFFMNIHKYGNTSAASVPLALVEAIEEGRCKPGDKIAICAFGSGLTWASALVQMGVGEISPAHSWLSAGRALYLAHRAVNSVQDVVQNILLQLATRRYESNKKR